MNAIAVFVILAGALVIGLLAWPVVVEELDRSRRQRQIARLRRRTLMDLDYLAERAWHVRSQQDRKRLDEIVDQLDL